MFERIEVRSSQRLEFIDITGDVQGVISAGGVDNGVCYIYVPHTTAAVTINEGADPSVKRDIQTMLNKLIPHHGDYHHMEGNSDAHIKATLVGTSETIMIDKGRLVLGTWQSIYFCEFDGPRSREVYVRILVT